MADPIAVLQAERTRLTADLARVDNALAALKGLSGGSSTPARKTAKPATAKATKPARKQAAKKQTSGVRAKRVTSEKAQEMVAEAIVAIGEGATSRQIEEKTGLNYAAVRRAIKSLTDLGVVEQTTEGKRNAGFKFTGDLDAIKSGDEEQGNDEPETAPEDGDLQEEQSEAVMDPTLQNGSSTNEQEVQPQESTINFD
jgi:ribosomal protein S25